MTKKLTPLRDKVIVKPEPAEEKTKSGIVLPDSAKEKPQEGKIAAAGPGKLDEHGKRVPMEVKKGDRVLYSKYGGTEINIEGDKYLIMREDDILGVIE